jgi:hypothetical protein
MRYTLQDFNDIIFNGYDYTLPDNVKATIKKLSLEFGNATVISITETVKENNKNHGDPRYKKQDFFNKNRKNNRAEINDDVWEKTKAFKATIIEKKAGIDKTINDIRICLNKISNKNYHAHRDTIIDYIRSIANAGEDSSDDDGDERREKLININTANVEIISKAIFDIASTNKFYSELYATLYRELIEKFPVFRENIKEVVDGYKASIHKIVFVDSNEDYDNFCDNNKQNDKRKSLVSFIINLMKQDVIERSTVADIIIYLEDIVIKNVDIQNMTYEIEEITENMFIFITESMSTLNTNPIWETIVSNIVMLSKYKAKEHVSLSNRAIFKYMDILDKVKR